MLSVGFQTKNSESPDFLLKTNHELEQLRVHFSSTEGSRPPIALNLYYHHGKPIEVEFGHSCREDHHPRAQISPVSGVNPVDDYLQIWSGLGGETQQPVAPKLVDGNF